MTKVNTIFLDVLELTVQFYHGDVVVQVARMEVRMIAGELKMNGIIWMDMLVGEADWIL